MEFNIQELVHEYSYLLLKYGTRLLIAILIFLIGHRVIKVIVKKLRKYFDKKDFDPAMESFILSSLNITLKIILVVSILTTMGLQMTSLVAVLGAAGFAIGMALSGTLQNFAGGIIILVLKPFKIGDFVEMQGHSGTVTGIQIFHTIIYTTDNRKVILPNGPVASGSLTNFNVESTRRISWTFGIGYGDDYNKAKNLLLSFINEDQRIHKSPEPFIVISSLSDSSVDITARVWVDTPKYWDVFFAMNERVYNEFPKSGISIPFPQIDVHIQNNK